MKLQFVKLLTDNNYYYTTRLYDCGEKRSNCMTSRCNLNYIMMLLGFRSSGVVAPNSIPQVTVSEIGHMLSYSVTWQSSPNWFECFL